MASSKGTTMPPPEGMMRSTYTLGVLGFGFSAWAVFLGGLAAIHGALSNRNSYIIEFDTFAFSWFLVCGYLILWITIMLCWLWGVMPSASRVLTPIIAIFIAWFGVRIQEILKLLLIAYKKNTLEGRFLVWAVGCVACAVCLGAMLLVVASWEPHAEEMSMIKAFHSRSAPTTHGLRLHGHPGTANGDSSTHIYTPYGAMPPTELGGTPFGEPLVVNDAYQESGGLGNSTSDRGASTQEVTLQLKGSS